MSREVMTRVMTGVFFSGKGVRVAVTTTSFISTVRLSSDNAGISTPLPHTPCVSHTEHTAKQNTNFLIIYGIVSLNAGRNTGPDAYETPGLQSYLFYR